MRTCFITTSTLNQILWKPRLPPCLLMVCKCRKQNQKTELDDDKTQIHHVVLWLQRGHSKIPVHTAWAQATKTPPNHILMCMPMVYTRQAKHTSNMMFRFLHIVFVRLGTNKGILNNCINFHSFDAICNSSPITLMLTSWRVTKLLNSCKMNDLDNQS